MENSQGKENKNLKNNNHVESGYISLQEASKIFPYSQEYLSLLARRGKIHSKKFGRNWYTTKESVNEYLKKQGIPIIIPKDFFPSYNGRISKPVLTSFYFSKEKEEELRKLEEKKLEEEKSISADSAFVTTPVSPESLVKRESVKEVAMASKEEKIELVKSEIKKTKESPLPPKKIFSEIFQLKFIAGFAIILFFLITSLFYILSAKSEKIAFRGWLNEKRNQVFKNIKYFFVEAPKGIALPNKIINPENIFLFERDFSGLEENIVGDVKGRFGTFRQEFGLVKPEIEEKENGVVIVPKNLKDGDLFKKELETAFADKVEVLPDETGKAGTIKPVFAASAKEQSYLYMMVPTTKKEN